MTQRRSDRRRPGGSRVGLAGLAVAATLLAACAAPHPVTPTASAGASSPLSAEPQVTPSSPAVSTVSPSGGPTIAPSTSPGPPLPVLGQAQVPGGLTPMTVMLLGDPAVVRGIRPATDAERAKVSAALERDLWIGSLDSRTILVGWLGGACDVTATLTIEPARIVLAEGPRHACDAVGIVKAVVVTFVEPVDVTALEPVFVRVVPTP